MVTRRQWLGQAWTAAAGGALATMAPWARVRAGVPDRADPAPPMTAAPDTTVSLSDWLDRDGRLRALADVLRASPGARAAMLGARRHLLPHQDLTWLAPAVVPSGLEPDSTWFWSHLIDRRVPASRWLAGGSVTTMSGLVLHVRSGGRELVSGHGRGVHCMDGTLAARDGELIVIERPLCA